MKILVLFCAAFLLALAGCGKKSETTSGPGENALNAPADYLGAMGQAKKLAEKTVDVAALNKAIQMFNASEGRNPTNLQELVDGKYIPALPEPPPGMKIVYDAAAGTVKVVKQ